MPAGVPVLRSPLAGLLKWGRGRDEATAEPSRPLVSADTIAASKVLPRFLSVLSSVPAPVLMDLGPVVGTNISFFGERLSCKIFVEDLFATIDADLRSGASAASVSPRLSHPSGSIDGILCWDLFDYLSRPMCQELAARLVALLRPGGVLYGFFSTAPAEIAYQTRFVVEGSGTLRLRPAPAAPTRRNVLVTRDITRMFEGLAVTESVLLKSRTREILFRKP